MNGFGNKSIFWSTLGAFCLHLIWAQLPIPIPNSPLNPSGEKEQIFIEPLDLNKPVVQTSRADSSTEPDEDSARFGGEFRNRVKREFQSPLRGRFREGGAVEDTDPESVLPRLSDLLPFGASPNALPKDILVGPETLLNTDRVLYASFINRIGDEIYEPWSQLVRDALDYLNFRGKSVHAETYITKHRVSINKFGEIISIHTVESCGIDELDDTSKRAFWKSEPFPHPPSQMFEKEDTASFVYEFHIDIKQSLFQVRPWNT